MRRTPVQVPGFRFAGIHCGLKESGKRDIALIVCDRPAAAAGAFTTNLVKAAPVRIGQERIGSGAVQAILVNSGNANAYTGRQGEVVAREMTRVVAAELGIDERFVIPSSTGRIGVPLPRQKVLRGVRQACRELSPERFHDALDGMMTTDAFPKFAAETFELEGRRVTLAGMAKGAGMIAPDMATMLAYLLTDARVSPAGLQAALREALPLSFNSIVVDGDTSTNDTVLLLASGSADHPLVSPRSGSFRRFSEAVAGVMYGLARMVVKDGEGATRVVDIFVRGARNARDAARVADAIARSPLCKTAFFGGDPYAGRIVCAAGYSGARFDPERLDVYLDDLAIVRSGVEVAARVERRAAQIVSRPEFSLTLDLHAGKATAQRMTSDLTVDYVKFNSAYRT